MPENTMPIATSPRYTYEICGKCQHYPTPGTVCLRCGMCIPSQFAFKKDKEV